MRVQGTEVLRNDEDRGKPVVDGRCFIATRRNMLEALWATAGPYTLQARSNRPPPRTNRLPIWAETAHVVCYSRRHQNVTVVG